MKALPSGVMVQDDRQDVSLQVKLADCVLKFRDKFGNFPSVIWLHKETLGNYVSPNGLRLETSQYCRSNIFLVGPLPEAEAATGRSGACARWFRWEGLRRNKTAASQLYPPPRERSHRALHVCSLCPPTCPPLTAEEAAAEDEALGLRPFTFAEWQEMVEAARVRGREFARRAEEACREDYARLVEANEEEA